jgi:glycosyltransferase involved in cell wall biosynthesis
MLEAAAAGLPIVATRAGGVEEAVVRSARVRLCEVGDIAGLAAGVESLLLARPDGTIPVTGNPLPKEFHIEEMVKQYQSLYDRLLSQRGNKLMPRSREALSSEF